MTPVNTSNMALPLAVYAGVTGEAVAMPVNGPAPEVARRLQPSVGVEEPGVRLAALFDTHHQRLYRLARRLSGHADDARDLVQETFLRAARSPTSVPFGASSEEAWLVRVLINVCRDGWRKKQVRSRFDPLHAAESVPRPASDQETALVARATIWRALCTLPPRRRAVLVLYELEGTGIPAIARLLGVSPVTVRWHLSLGRRELARIIRGDES